MRVSKLGHTLRLENGVCVRAEKLQFVYLTLRIRFFFLNILHILHISCKITWNLT